MFTCVALSPRSLSDCAERERQRLEQTPLAASLQGRARSTKHKNICRLVPTSNEESITEHARGGLLYTITYLWDNRSISRSK